MITEDYVSFEVAKLLKDKGFDEKCYVNYNFNGETQHFNYHIPSDGVACPTLQIAMKWLREVHKLHIIIQYGNVGQPKDPQMQYWFEVVDAKGQYCDSNIVDGNTSYEEACEAAIKYCLENLI